MNTGLKSIEKLKVCIRDPIFFKLKGPFREEGS